MSTNFSGKNLIGLVVILVVLILVWWAWKAQGIIVATDKKEYENGGIMKVTIRNLSLKQVCFSSCYPYYLEQEVGEWEPYDYQHCPYPDLAEKCFGPLGSKKFEIILPEVKEGVHRIAVPVCMSCEDGQAFTEDRRFYSDKFEIK